MTDFLRIIACWKYSSAAFHFRLEAPAVKQVQKVFIIEFFISAVQELAVSGCLCNEVHDRRAVCQIAAPFSRDAHLEAHFGHFLKELDRSSLVSCSHSRQKAGYAAPYDADCLISRAHITSAPPHSSDGGSFLWKARPASGMHT